jgi:hypothetical protein
VSGLSNYFPVAIIRRLSERDKMGWVVFALSVALALPCLVFQYLPMVDLPQHEAILSIMLHMRSAAFGFDSYYTWATDRTLYIIPYAVGFVLSQVMPLRLALHIVVFCAVLSYPLGILLCLRALSRPLYLGLLALPLMYNQSFYWGFINFNLAIGLGFITLSLLIGKWSRRKAFLVVLVSLATALTHVYGLVMLGSYMGLWLLLGERRAASRRFVALIPAALALALWVGLVSKARGFEGFHWAGIANRWSKLLEAIAGGWRDKSETIFLCCIFLAIVAFSRRTMPITPSRWNRLSLHQRAVWAFIALHLMLYFSMPELPVAANKAIFRHAEMAALALPLTVASDDASAASTWLRLGLIALTVAVMGSSWSHFRRFNKEARSFDAIISAVPSRSRIVQLTYDRTGKVAHVPAYMHFAAYAQANKGGLLAVSFPARFWNIPVAVRFDATVPDLPKGLEWNPQLFEERSWGAYFDTVIVREPRTRTPDLPPPFQYQLQTQSGPWRLYLRQESIHE